MIKLAAIVLAGGKAQRFQTNQEDWQDKALANLDGKPLLVHVIENVQDVVDEVVVVANEGARRSSYQNVLTEHHVENARIVTDLEINHLSGPLVAILTGLKFSNADYCLTIPTDMPMLSRKVANYMFNQIKDSYVAVPMWPNGSLETLLMILKRSETTIIATLLSELGRSRPAGIIRGALNVLFVSPLGKIKVLDPELKSFVNINYPEDLSRLQPRNGQGSKSDNLRLNLGNLPVEQLEHLHKANLERNNSCFLEASKLFQNCAIDLEEEKSFFWAAISREYEAKSWLGLSKQNNKGESISCMRDAFSKAAFDYGSEAKIYEENGCCLLAERAKADKLWCESQIKL
jgi:molybdopterin-guanine dinucleotide biosynthesis protein A